MEFDDWPILDVAGRIGLVGVQQVFAKRYVCGRNLTGKQGCPAAMRASYENDMCLHGVLSRQANCPDCNLCTSYDALVHDSLVVAMAQAQP